MNVTIIGAGYVGVISGVCLAHKGHDVAWVDADAELVQELNAGKPRFYEPGLEELLRSVFNSGRIRATNSLPTALDHSDLVLIAVGTPSKNGVIDLGAITQVSREIGEYLKCRDRYLAVVVKSTVIPGTTDTLVGPNIAQGSGKSISSFGLGMNPEFLREGNAISDFMDPDRIVLGYEDDRTLALLESLYAPWPVEKLRVNTRTAELIKYAGNALLATQISTINEIANLAERLGGIDITQVLKGVHLDKRWSPVINDRRVFPDILAYLVPGCGFGGSCFPKDVEALRSQGVENGLPMHVLNAVLEVNHSQPGRVIEALEREFDSLSSKTVMVLGLAFKPGTDDVRESPSLKIVRGLLKKGARVLAHDPVAVTNFRMALGREGNAAIFLETWADHVDLADAIIIATAWPEYLDLVRLDLSEKILFDARSIFQPSASNCRVYLCVGSRVGPKKCERQ